MTFGSDARRGFKSEAPWAKKAPPHAGRLRGQVTMDSLLWTKLTLLSYITFTAFVFMLTLFIALLYRFVITHPLPCTSVGHLIASPHY